MISLRSTLALALCLTTISALRAQLPADTHGEDQSGERGGGSGANCDCWVEPTSSYHTILNGSEWDASGFNSSDEGSYGPIALPFPFYLYGQTWDSVYINVNGNVSFDNPFGIFNATGFPITGYTIVAPFWADVDLGGSGATNNIVQYQVTTHALFVNWIRVGYYSGQVDKVNTFQLILSDGLDPHIPNGNVSFCYRDMQWTTGSASGGVNGFGGIPASVGANNGNGVDYLQFGRFDHAGTDYDGPYGGNDGVSWLDFKDFQFTTDVTTGNVPPVISGQTVCDTLDVCVGQIAEVGVTFLSPESEQTTTITSNTATLSNFTITQNTSGLSAELLANFTPGFIDVGYHTLIFTGTDDGDPVASSSLSVVIHVLPPDPLPPIDAQICPADTGAILFDLLSEILPAGGTWTDPDTLPFGGIFHPGTDVEGSYTYLEPPIPSCPHFVVVNVSLVPFQNDTVITGPSCPGLADGSIEVITTGDTPPWDYTWTDATGIVIQTTIGSLGDSLSGAAGTYQVQVIQHGDSTTCTQDLTMMIVDPEQLVTIPVNDTTICLSGTAMLSAMTTGGTDTIALHWDQGLVGEGPHMVSPTADTTYFVYATDSNNCLSDSASVTVHVLPPLYVSLPDTISICPSVDLVIMADSVAGGDGQWTYDWGMGASLEPSITVNIPATQTFCVTLTDGCETPPDTACVVVDVKPLPPVVLSADSILGCEPFLVTFFLVDTSGLATTDWEFGDGSVYTGQADTLAHTYAQHGTYSVLVNVHWPNGCSLDSLYADMITVVDLPHADFSWTPQPANIFENEVQFQELADELAVTFEWDLAGLATSILPDPTFTFPNEQGGSYPVELIARNFLGCADTITKIVEVQDEFLVYTPTAFSPDGDGLNESFTIQGNDISPNGFHLMIFDRWGERIFDTTSSTEGWDGKFNGKVVRNGVYTWMLRAQSIYTGINHDLRGHVTVVD